MASPRSRGPLAKLSMASFKRTIPPDPEVLAVIVTCTEFNTLQDGRAQARLDHRLGATLLAERTEKVLSDLGGPMEPNAGCIVLPEGIDPKCLVDQLLNEGYVTVTASIALAV